MANNVKFTDFSLQVKAAMSDNIIAKLEECAAEIESQTKRNSRVKTTQTKISFQHKVVESELTAYVGSSYINAIYEEYGTGEFALNGNGRKGGWYYVDDDGNGHWTHGKKPSRAMWHAYTSLRKACEKQLENALGGLR